MLINGERASLISALDRGIAYGDGLFETIAAQRDTLLYWERHMTRLNEGCDRLQLPMPEPSVLLREAQAVADNHSQSVIKIIVTRGVGGAAYTAPLETAVTRIVMRRSWPTAYAANAQHGINVNLATHPLPHHPVLAGIKHLNRLDQVIASHALRDTDVEESLMMDYDGNLIEGTRSNLFIVKGGELLTPDLRNCGVKGVMRKVVFDLAQEIEFPVHVRAMPLATLDDADEIFLCNSIAGIWPVVRVRTDPPVNYEVGPLTRSLQQMLRAKESIER